MGATEGKQPYARNLRTLDLTKTCSTAKPTVYDIRNERQRVQLTLARYLARTGSLHGFWPATELEGKALQALLKTRPHLGIPAKYKPDHSDMEAHSASLREHRRQAVSAGLDPRHLPRINSEPSLFLLESFGSDVDSVGQLETSLFDSAWPPAHMVDSVAAPDPPAETSSLASASTSQELEIMAPDEIEVHCEFPQSGGLSFAPQDQSILTAQYLAASSALYAQTVLGVPLVPDTYTPHTHHAQDSLRVHRRQAVSAGLDPRHLPRINSDPSLFLLGSFGNDVASGGELETSLFNLAWPPTHMVDSVTAPDPPAETSPASAYTLQELEIMAPGEIQVHYEFPQSGGFAPQDQDILTAQYLAASSEPYQQTVPGVPLVPYTYTPHTHHVQDGLWEWEAITEVSSTGSGGPNEPQQTPPQASFWVCTPPEPQPAGFSSWH